jgi:hypothetical protein
MAGDRDGAGQVFERAGHAECGGDGDDMNPIAGRYPATLQRPAADCDVFDGDAAGAKGGGQFGGAADILANELSVVHGRECYQT